MKQEIHNSVRVGRSGTDRYNIYWSTDNEAHDEYICSVHGFDNAIRVANGIAHNQVEYVISPPNAECGR